MQVLRYEAAGWGIGELAWHRGRLLYLTLPSPTELRERPKLPQGIPEIPVVRLANEAPRASATSASELARRVVRYFAGESVGFGDVELDLDGYTPFQRQLVSVLRALPRGETVSYGELAALAGRPNAQRAAGSFCARNRFSLVVPCHRVVAADGLGSYGPLGPAYKQRLLELEQGARTVTHAPVRPVGN
jgi:methylated-DNA-[protein]-cysteine S-methyltransferase